MRPIRRRALLASVVWVSTAGIWRKGNSRPEEKAMDTTENLDTLDQSATAGDAVHPFRVHFPDAELAELRRRINATRWPERETVSDQSQGPELETMQKLARYWQTEYDWRKVEARLNALPNFVTRIDGQDIHFIHLRSKHKN